MSDDTQVFVILTWKAFWLQLAERWTSRKFVLCVFLEVVTAYAGLTRIIEAGTWLAFGSLILGTYCGASITDKNLNGGKG